MSVTERPEAHSRWMEVSPTWKALIITKPDSGRKKKDTGERKEFKILKQNIDRKWIKRVSRLIQSAKTAFFKCVCDVQRVCANPFHINMWKYFTELSDKPHVVIKGNVFHSKPKLSTSVALNEKTEDHQNLFPCLAWMVTQNSRSLNPVVAEIFQSQPKCLLDCSHFPMLPILCFFSPTQTNLYGFSWKRESFPLKQSNV